MPLRLIFLSAIALAAIVPYRTVPRTKQNLYKIPACLSGKSVSLFAMLGYARVSTTDQNLNLQRDALKAAGCKKIFSDRGVSGSALSRPQLARALKALRPGDTLVVWKLDRLGRSLSHLVETISDLGRRGINFRSLSDPIDTESAGGRFVLHIMAALAEFERSLIVERTRAGLAAATKRGVKLGRTPRLDEKKIAKARRLIEGGESPGDALAFLASPVRRSTNRCGVAK